MTFESPLEIYLFLYGWKQFYNFWSILAEVGLIYLPLGWIALETVLRAAKSAETGVDAAVASRRPMVIELGVALVVIALAMTPFSTIQTSSLSYINPCVAAEQGSTGATGTTYDNAFNSEEEAIELPLWWEGVLALSYGLNRAALEGLGCTEDIILARQQVDETRIQDPILATDLQAFRDQCFYPARSLFQERMQDAQARQAWGQAQTGNGYTQADLEWEGSAVYLNWAAFKDAPRGPNKSLYAILHAHDPVPGFPFDPVARESDLNHAQLLAANAQAAANGGTFNVQGPIDGFAYCDEWWEGTTADNGLRTRLLAQHDDDLLTQVSGLFSTKTQREREDDLLMSLLAKEINLPQTASFAGSAYTTGADSGFIGSAMQFGTDVASNLGIGWEKLSTMPMLNAVKAALPMIKAFLMMMVIMLIPIVLVASAYRLNKLFLITVGLVSINFLSVIWGVAWALENDLLTALWPDQVDAISQGKYTLSTLADPNWSLKIEVLKFLLPFLYLFLPIVFFSVIGWAGYTMFGAVGNAMSALSLPISQAGKAGADKLKSKL